MKPGDRLYTEDEMNELREQLETQKAMTSGFRLRMHALLAVCEDYLLWEPRKRGHAEQHNRFSEYVRAERELLGEPPYPADSPLKCPRCGSADFGVKTPGDTWLTCNNCGYEFVDKDDVPEPDPASRQENEA